MIKNPTNILFMITLILGSLITISSSTWLGCWIGLEINLLSFIPLMNKKSQLSSESSLKYFLIQALASAVFLTSILIMSFYNNTTSQDISLNDNLFLVMSSSLLMKMGAAPFHFWFPGVMEGLDWLNNLILMTWQKLAPFLTFSYVLNNQMMMSLVVISCVIMGSVGGLNQTSMRKIMAYSSINHLGWMTAAMLLNNIAWIIYFIIYSFLSFIMISIFMNYNISHNLQMYNLNQNKNMSLMLFCNLLSLGGLPPFLGFLPKWMVIQLLVNNGFIMLALLMVSFTLFALFFYARIAYPSFMMSHSEMKWNMLLNNKMSYMIFFLSTLNFLGLLFSPLISIFI
uniref:NADH-ubiquinone oxidoreductase chain 2 n=1 Tax=Choroterpes yixingensis TaxID=2861365 RepID=A0A8F7GRR4_9INSE|nr:NADH dehydrogenase subunit 2 [Choroterpes yixingensis]